MRTGTLQRSREYFNIPRAFIYLSKREEIICMHQNYTELWSVRGEKIHT